MKKLEHMTEPELQELMSLVCYATERAANIQSVEKPLFCVVLFNDPAAAQYAGNCRRDDMVKALCEAADRLEKREDVTR